MGTSSWHGQVHPCGEKQLPRPGLRAAALLRTQPGFSVVFSVFPVVLPTGAMTAPDNAETSLLLLPVPGWLPVMEHRWSRCNSSLNQV